MTEKGNRVQLSCYILSNVPEGEEQGNGQILEETMHENFQNVIKYMNPQLPL